MAMQKSMEVKMEFESHMQYLKSPEMVKKEEEMAEQEKQLRDIEKALGAFKNCKSILININPPWKGF